MNAPLDSRRILILTVVPVDGGNSIPVPRLAKNAEVFTLTESNGREALEKIFAADTVAVWSDIPVVQQTPSS